MMDVEYLITLRSEKEEFRGSKHFAKGNRRKGSDQGRMYFPLFRRTTVEKAMAPHSSTPVWKIPWTEEPDRLQSMGSLRVRHNFTFTFTFHFHALGKEMATHSSVLAWRIPGTGEPGGLPSMGSHRVGHD